MLRKFTKEETATLIYLLYEQPGCEAGGNCHIATDDFNLEDEHLLWCSQESLRKAVAGEIPRLQYALETSVCDALAGLAAPDRQEVCEDWLVLATR